GEFVGEQFLHAALIHDQPENIRGRSTNLQSVASAFNSYRCRRAESPRTAFPARNKAASIFAAHNESCFFHARNNHDASRLIVQVARDALVGLLHNFSKREHGIFESLVRSSFTLLRLRLRCSE